MLRIVECAASGVLLVIPDGSHALRREEKSNVALPHRAARNAEIGGNTSPLIKRSAFKPA